MSEYTIREIKRTVPLDYSNPEGKQIELYARDIYKEGNENADLLVFFQGGPGFPCPRDIEATAWLKHALEKFRVVLPDQRGTGKSQKIGIETAAQFETSQELAEYISHFRADNIVRDAEWIRKEEFGGQKWYSLGQSYGGFITTTYLSFAPEALKGSMITGGLAPINKQTVKDVYKANLENVYKRNQQLYTQYPEDKEKVKKIVGLLREHPFEMAPGDVMTAERFLEAGMILGTTNGTRKLHYMLDNPFTDFSETALSWSFVHSVNEIAYETNPIFAFVHELIYCDGNRASGWAAYSCMNEDERFAPDHSEMICFRGECIRPGMFDDHVKLQPFKEAAAILAEKADWAPLYDFEQLVKNEVPVEAFVYDTDFYVDMQGSLDCAASIKGCNVHRHPEWQHDSIHSHTKEVLGALMDALEKRTLVTN